MIFRAAVELLQKAFQSLSVLQNSTLTAVWEELQFPTNLYYMHFSSFLLQLRIFIYILGKNKKILVYLHKLIAHRRQKGSFVFFYPFPDVYKKLHGPPAMKLLSGILQFAECSLCEQTACDSIPRAEGIGW